MISIRRVILKAACLGLSVFLAGCKTQILDPEGIIATQEKHIIFLSTLLMLLIVIPVILLSWFIAWRYRASNTKATYSPEWSHSTRLEIIWWSIPCGIIGVLGTITWISSHRLDPYRPLPDAAHQTLTIEAIALDWKWLFIYPEQNIATVNYVAFPAGVPIRFLITADGAMNSFQIPQLAGQIYAMAGMQSKLYLMADHEGDYRGFSASFSGNGFSDMKFVAHATSLASFNEWVKTVKQSPNQLTMPLFEKLVQPSTNNPVAYYASANEKIFNREIMKSMMPHGTH